jgi:hypothetical protein
LDIKEPSESKMIISAETLKNLFITLSKNKMEYLQIVLRPKIDETISNEELEELKHSFMLFLENFSPGLYHLGLYLLFN